MDILVTYSNYNFSEPIKYTFDLIFSIYGVAYEITPFNRFKPDEHDLSETLVISYGREYLATRTKRQIHIYASDFFGKNYLKPASMPETPLSKYLDLPVIYCGRSTFDNWIRESENLIETNIDIIASSFFMLSRYEEVVQDTKDEHDRFPAKASLAYKEGFLDRPIVNEYIELLRGWIKALRPEMARKSFWPDNRDFAVCLTHDVDVIRKYRLFPVLLSIGGKILKHGKLREAVDLAVEYGKIVAGFKKDPYDTFDYIIKVEKDLGFKSSFYFRFGWNEYDSGDTVKRTEVKRLVKWLEKTGCEIGLHASFNSYDNLDMMAAEKKELDKVVSSGNYGCRQHYLRWKTPDTWRLQEKAGLLYDATLSFADHVGFRCGICLPYQPFDVVENRKLAIWELPLIIQEGTLHGASYQNLPPKVAYDEIVKHIEITKRFKGVFVLLWHNSSFDRLGGWSGWKDVYEDVMSYIGKQNAFTETGKNIIKWWETNSTLR